MEIEIEKLQKYSCTWEAEIRILKQEEENMKNGLVFLKDSLRATENRQQKMETFLAKSSTNAKFIPQFIQQLELEEDTARNNGTSDWSGTTMLPFLKPKLLQLKGLKESESPFLRKTFEMVDDPNTDSIITWSSSGASFFIRDKSKFTDLLLQYFGHDTFKNFTNCLGSYDFKRVDSFLNEFFHENFRRGQKHMIKHIKKKPNKSEIMKNLLQDMVAEVKRLRDHQDMVIKKGISKLKQQEERTRNQLASVKQAVQRAKCKLMQLKEGSNPTYHCRKGVRPWLDPFKNIDKLKNDMEKTEMDILKLESNQELKMNNLTALEVLVHGTGCSQHQLEISMGKTLTILGFDEEVRKNPNRRKVRHGKVTRRRKPMSKNSSVQSISNPSTAETDKPNCTMLNSEDLAWARELEDDMSIEAADEGLDNYVKERNSNERFETSCTENSEDINIWARDLEDHLICESEKKDKSENYVEEQSRNPNFGSYNPESFEELNKYVTTLNDSMLAKSFAHASNNHVHEQSRNDNVGTRNEVTLEDLDVWFARLLQQQIREMKTSLRSMKDWVAILSYQAF